MDKLNKTYGTDLFSHYLQTTGDYDVISRSIGFDYVTLGVGGFVKGKCMNLWAGEGTINLICIRYGTGTVLY
jgi:hypothetical protein